MSAIFRDDLSDRLIHLTKGEGQEPLANLLSILNEKKLRGGDGFIKGGHKCACFSEAPLSKLPQILSTPHETVKYKPFGVMFRKRWIFERGGLPVIYQPDADYDKLPDEKKHLHVRFSLGDSYDTDYTWEREWRVKTPALNFEPTDVTVIVPSRIFSDALAEHHYDNQSQTRARDASFTTEIYPWHVIALEDLGIPIPDRLP